MNLNIFDNLTRDDNGMQDFIKELNDFLGRNGRKDISLLEEVEQEQKIITAYRDKMKIERNNILDNYAKENAEVGEFYYVYSKASGKDLVYNLCIYGGERNHDIVKLKENELPKGAGMDSVLKNENGKYVLDNEATEEVLKQMRAMIDKLLEEQAQMLDAHRIEGHAYEVVANLGDRLSLIDRTKNDGNCFEEIDCSKEILNSVATGTMLKYINGEYEISSK